MIMFSSWYKHGMVKTDFKILNYLDHLKLHLSRFSVWHSASKQYWQIKKVLWSLFLIELLYHCCMLSKLTYPTYISYIFTVCVYYYELLFQFGCNTLGIISVRFLVVVLNNITFQEGLSELCFHFNYQLIWIFPWIENKKEKKYSINLSNYKSTCTIYSCIDELMQERCNSIAYIVELCFSCTNPMVSPCLLLYQCPSFVDCLTFSKVHFGNKLVGM